MRSFYVTSFSIFFFFLNSCSLNSTIGMLLILWFRNSISTEFVVVLTEILGSIIYDLEQGQ